MLLKNKDHKQEINSINIYNAEFFEKFFELMKTFFKKTNYNRLEAIYPTRIVMSSNTPFIYDEDLYCPCFAIYYRNIHIMTLNSVVFRYNTSYNYTLHHCYKNNKLYTMYEYLEMEEIIKDKRMCSDLIQEIFSYL